MAMTLALAHRSNVPFMVSVPDDPDALKLIRLLLLLFDFAWRNRGEILLFVENVNRLFDVAEATLDVCAVCYDGWMWVMGEANVFRTAL
jgi:hypothetical protein